MHNRPTYRPTPFPNPCDTTDLTGPGPSAPLTCFRAPAVPITNGPIPGSRYKSPYAQPVRNRSPHRTASSSATGYQSGPSPDASLARQRGEH
jgi:hypothetical protein